ncbi:FimV/HubP family polar landmark protein [Shewanella intestini]|uniref:LysM peptidoglycan-binding domain-containing protein n=1 Tax=Shewanella intestini TaxID=2017544 RepID=A0ABS5I4X4_9GAMM|nr:MULTISPECIES: FimV/HubP family polar landmark protein [Shewanella]MBR9729076.1 LysM peptidoglycan-binding domain-containing protein [Shewanella intestini]MRG37152.1 LysM peptidoglycan-binding domain-containing protein [Shewanella sp. XMDDZSB0408]
MKAFAALALLATLAISITAPVFAEISHVKIDTKQFEAGSLPTITVNVTSEYRDLSRLQFYLRQIYQGTIVLEKLEVISNRGGRLELQGKESFRDPNAVLIVSERRQGKWQQYKPVPVFDPPVISVNNKQPIGVKTMKTGAKSKAYVQADLTSSVEGCHVIRAEGDTLWRIAAKNEQHWGTNTFGAMLAIYYANPRAFKGNYIKRLRADSQLTCPSTQELAQYIDINQDKQAFDALVAAGKPDAKTQTVKDEQPKTQAGTAKVEADLITVSSTVEAKQTKAPTESLVVAREIESQVAAESEVNTVSESSVSTMNDAPVEIVEPIKPALTDAQKSQAIVEDINNAHIAVKLADISEPSCQVEQAAGDTLWKLAQKNRQAWNVGLFGAMLAIYEANPKAFSNNKISKMRADVALVCPSEQQLQIQRDTDNTKEKFDQLAAQ